MPTRIIHQSTVCFQAIFWLSHRNQKTPLYGWNYWKKSFGAIHRSRFFFPHMLVDWDNNNRYGNLPQCDCDAVPYFDFIGSFSFVVVDRDSTGITGLVCNCAPLYQSRYFQVLIQPQAFSTFRFVVWTKPPSRRLCLFTQKGLTWRPHLSKLFPL